MVFFCCCFSWINFIISFHLECSKRSIVRRINQSNKCATLSEKSESKGNGLPSKKIKANSQDQLSELIRKQNEELHDLRKEINDIDKESQKCILRYNKQSVPRDKTEVRLFENTKPKFDLKKLFAFAVQSTLSNLKQFVYEKLLKNSE